MRRDDRHDAGLLGLLVLASAFVFAPLLHTLDHGHAHDHGPVAPGAPHGAGSLEHQLLAFMVPVEAAPPVFFAVSLPQRPAPSLPCPQPTHRWCAEQPQGP